MIRLAFTLSNPFSKTKFDSFFVLDGKIFGHKYWEIQSVRDMSTLLEFEVDLTWRGRDHPGPSLTIGLFGHYVLFKIYDSRHWDHENDDWQK